jgi:hypothetical protein
LLYLLPLFNFVASYRARDANIMNLFISFYMVYSKRVTDLQQIYQLTPDDVFFCMLVASGASRGEAYATIFRPRSTKIETAQRGAAQLAKDKPGINKLIRSFEDNRAAFIPDNDRTKSKKKKKNTETEEENAGNVVQYRDKDAVLSGLEQTLPDLRGKDRADVLMKIADLQQMKKDENTEEEETVHYYLPLQCYRCNLFIADRAKRKAEKPDNI